MAYRRLRSPRQPLAVRWLLGLFEFLASLQLAVVVILACAVVLAWATVIERNYGTEGVRFGVYGTWWFALLNLFLGLNVLCAALIRFPWKRHQTGFVIVHAGILVLLVGCWLTREHGIDADLPIFEESAYSVGYQDTQRFRLTVWPRAPLPGGEDADRRDQATTIDIPFAAGPFNWEDYGSLPWFPWALTRPARGFLYDRDGITLEALDYYSNAAVKPAEPIELRVKSRSQPGTPDSAEDSWQSVSLRVQSSRNPQMPSRRIYLGSKADLANSSARICYWVAGSQAETEAFLDSRPRGSLDSEGVLLLHAAGEKFEIPAEKLKSRNRIPLGDTGIQIQSIPMGAHSEMPLLQVYARGTPARKMMVLPDSPHVNQQDPEHGVYGVFWTPEPEGDGPSAPDKQARAKASRGRSGSPRIDVIQGADGKLYYRVWKSPQVTDIGELPTDRTRVAVLQDTPTPIVFYVAKHVRHDRPGERIEPIPFENRRGSHAKTRQARVRLTVDGRSEEFWLEGLPAVPDPPPPDQDQHRVVQGQGRRVEITLPWNEVALGFQVYLHEFDRRLDPGTAMDAYFASRVDFRTLPDARSGGGVRPGELTGEPIQENVTISMNAPADFSDPVSGRCYRLFQSSFYPPYKPGDPPFDQRVAPDSPRKQLYVSVLSVNYDPGRGLKYAGSLMVIAGVAIVFFMRAHFFRRLSEQGRIA